MVLTEFVDRVENMAELRSLVEAVVEGRGGKALVVDSVSGMGKSALLSEFNREAASSQQLGACRTVLTQCHPGIGSGLTYGPIVDLLLELRQEEKQPSVLRRILRFTGQGVVRSAPEVLSSIVPGLGAVFSLGREVTEASLASGSMPFDSLVPFQQGAASQIVEELLQQVRQGPPTVLMIDDIQHSDPSSLLVLDRLLRRLATEPLSIVLSHTTDGAHGEGPGAMVEELLQHWSAERLLQRRTLTGLPEEAVADLVGRRHPQAPAALSRRLTQVTGGHPIFLTLCLEEWKPEDGLKFAVPSSLERVVKERLQILTEEDRELLVIGATQGSTFLSGTVAEVKGAQHDHVMDRLHRIAMDHHLIVSEEIDEAPSWARSEPSDVYRFEHRALWSVVQRQQSPEQRRRRHARIAEALAIHTVDEPSMERRLEIARHLRHGGQQCLEASAEAHFALARDAAMEGLSFTEAEKHCEQAITATRRLPRSNESRDRRLIRAIELLLSLTEVRWQGQSRPTGGPEIDDLAAEAEAAAVRCQSRELLIRTSLLRGKTLLATEGLVPSLAKLREAVDLAEEHGDPVALFVSRVEYGRQISKRKLSEGLTQLREAERLYASDRRLDDSGDPVLQHARNLGEMQLGITLFDSGHLSEALTRLKRCAARLRSESLKAELPIALNYLAQVHTGLGEYQEAGDVLQEARAFEERRGGDSGWHAYNTALLAQLLVHQGRQSEGAELMREAWEETQRTWLANLVPIVRNLYADLLLQIAESDGELDHAYRLAADTCAETQDSGMIRSEIAAYSLLSRILLVQGDVLTAADRARKAMRILDEVGHMPALRTEEVLYHSAAVLRARGAHEEAQSLLRRAQDEVARKAALIDDDALRRRFQNDVPLNRLIRDSQGAG